MTLSIFPELLNYSLFGIFLLRAALGLTLILIGCGKLKPLGWLAIVIGFFLIIGLYTQAAALAAAIFSLLAVIAEVRRRRFNNLSYYLLILIIALALLFLGPGVFSLDLPL